MSTKKLQIIGSLGNQTVDADTLEGKHASEFAAAVDVEELKTKVGDTSVSEQINEALNNMGGEPYKQLVTDGEGNTVWEDRLAFSEFSLVEVLQEQTLTVSDPLVVDLEIPLSSPIIIGSTYLVHYNGTTYECIGKELITEFGILPAIGNIDAVIGNGDTGEPFALIYVDESLENDDLYTSFAIFGEETEFTVSIQEKQEKCSQVDPKYLPDGIGYEIETEEVLPETELVSGDGAFMNLTQPALAEVKNGAYYTVVYNGVEYQCKATVTVVMGELPVAVFGNMAAAGLGADTGEPFVYMLIPNAYAEFIQTLGLCLPLDGAETVTIAIPGGKKRRMIPTKFLPEGVGYEKEDGSVHSIALKYLPEYIYGTEGDISEVLGETNAVLGNDQVTYYITKRFTDYLYVDKEYVVTYNGHEYRDIARLSGLDGCNFIGDQFLQDYPFYIIDYYGTERGGEVEGETTYGQVCLADYNATFSIRNGGIYRKMPEEYMPTVHSVEMISPNGTKFKLTVSDDGALSVASGLVLTDETTGTKYRLFVNNAKLTMEVVE